MPTYQLLIDDKVVWLLEALKSRADTLHQATAISAQEPIGRSEEKAFGEMMSVMSIDASLTRAVLLATGTPATHHQASPSPAR